MPAKAGIVNFRVHDLRSTFNTNMRKAGVDHPVVMRLTGHKTAPRFQLHHRVDGVEASEEHKELERLLGQE